MADLRQPRATEADPELPAPPPYPGAPRWVKLTGIIVLILALLFAIILVTGVAGSHGPGRHGGGGDTPPSAFAGQVTARGPGGRAPYPSPPMGLRAAGRGVPQP